MGKLKLVSAEEMEEYSSLNSASYRGSMSSSLDSNDEEVKLEDDLQKSVDEEYQRLQNEIIARSIKNERAFIASSIQKERPLRRRSLDKNRAQVHFASEGLAAF